MIKFHCHCGLVRIELRKRPDYIHECNCSLCSGLGVRWAYLHPSEMSVEGETEGYCRNDKADPSAEIRFCPKCGSTTHFTLTESAVDRFGNSLTGVNVRLADEEDLAGLELRYPDGRAWSGHGAFDYVREARIIGEEGATG
ncbi:MAG TPA: aldehyde-activating protein [Allosphingosinicella sp.]